MQRESFNTYNFAISLVAGLILFEVFFGWYLVTQDIGRVSYIRILLTSAVLIGLWVQSHAARYFGAIWLLLSVTVLIWMLFAAHKVAFNFAALLTFVCGGLSFVASYILLFSKKFKVEYARQEELQPHYKRMFEKGTYCSRNIIVRGRNLTRYLSFAFGLMKNSETAAHRRFLRARR